MFGPLTRSLLAVSASVALLTTSAVAEGNAHTLPVFFFHGLTANAKIGDNLKANLSTEARPFVSLTFCQDACSLSERNNQTDLAITQIREIVASDKRFANGYTFVGHSQGGALARSVVETMDDHKVHTFISLAGASNGIFYGPQENDFVPAKNFLDYFAPFTPKEVYDYSNYTTADIPTGKLMIDMINDWVKYSTFLPKLNNLEPATDSTKATDQARRKANFLKLKEAHFFASKFDDTISPWQSSINGQYESVASLAELEASFTKLKMLTMEETPEYKQDTYGLQSLNKRGGLFLHEVDGVSHNCWVLDSTSPRDGSTCMFQPVFEKSVYPLLSPVKAGESTEPTKPHC